MKTYDAIIGVFLHSALLFIIYLEGTVLKITKRIAALLLAMTLILAGGVPALASDNPVLTIRGDGVEQEISFTLSQLKGMSDFISRNAYSAWNTWPTRSVYYAEGVALSALLEMAGLKDEATRINISEAPPDGGGVGYNITFLIDDLLAERFTFEGPKSPAPTIIALKLGERSFDRMDDVDMRLIHGQLAEQEQTTIGFVRSVRIITVTCDPVSKHPQPQYSVNRLPDGRYSVTLESSNASAKIYYTTDGSEPTVSSNMYNRSAPHWQPHLNVPFTVSGTTQVRAIAVATGFANSDVLTFSPEGGATDGDNAVGVEAEPGMANFARVSSYSPGQFSDVNENAWYGFNDRKAVATAYEYGLMRGAGDAVFNPAGHVTLAEAATIAARVHSIYSTGGESFVQGTPWYEVYVDYAVENGIISPDLSNFGRAATRAEMAYIFSQALPPEEFTKLNTVDSLPDVGDLTPYYASIFMLYEAGVLTGSDALGTFNHSSNITRAEAAAIISRVIIPDMRVSGLVFPPAG